MADYANTRAGPGKELTISQKSWLTSWSLMGILLIVSIAGLYTWIRVSAEKPYISFLPYLTEMIYVGGMFLWAFVLGRVRLEGLLAVILGGATFYILVVRLRGYCIYPGTFDLWFNDGGPLSRLLMSSTLLGVMFGFGSSFIYRHSFSRVLLRSKPSWIAFFATTLVTVLYVVLTTWRPEANPVFVPNQPIGIAVVWGAILYGMVAGEIASRTQGG